MKSQIASKLIKIKEIVDQLQHSTQHVVRYNSMILYLACRYLRTYESPKNYPFPEETAVQECGYKKIRIGTIGIKDLEQFYFAIFFNSFKNPREITGFLEDNLLNHLKEHDLELSLPLDKNLDRVQDVNSLNKIYLRASKRILEFGIGYNYYFHKCGSRNIEQRFLMGKENTERNKSKFESAEEDDNNPIYFIPFTIGSKHKSKTYLAENKIKMLPKGNKDGFMHRSVNTDDFLILPNFDDFIEHL